MKIAISMPDDTFDRATRRAKDLGLSRSEFFSQAANNYLDELDAHSVTAQINAAAKQIGSLDDSSVAAIGSGRRVVLELNDEW